MVEARAQRLALRGKEQRLFNLVYKQATPKQWGRWLRAPLECAIRAHDKKTTVALLKAGASCIGEEETGRLRHLLLSHPASIDRDGDSTIHVAVRLEDELLVETLLSKGADKEACDSTGRSPIRLAIQHSSLPAVKALLAAGADPTLRCPDDGCTALDVAAMGNRKFGRKRRGILSALLAAVGTDGVNAACSRGLTALHRSAFHNQLQPLEPLLQAGARVDAMDRDGWTPLFDACAEGSTDVMASLLRHGANRMHVDKRGRGLLHVAAERGHLPAVMILLQHGRIDVDLRYGSSQSSALDFAAIAGHADVLRALVEHGGAEVNGAMADGRTTCHRAAFFNQPTAIDELFRAGANLEAKTNSKCCSSSRGWTAMFDAAAAGSTDAVVALLKHKAEHSVRDGDGRTPLLIAAEADHAGVCSALLAGGANPFLRYGHNDNELSALDVAVREGNLDIVVAIIELWPTGLNSADSGGYTALHHGSSHVPVINALLKAGAAVDAVDGAGWTPLFDACAQGSSDAVAALLHHEANAKALDSEGRSPLHLAAQRGFPETTDYLLAAGADFGRRFGKSECSALDLAVVEGHLEVLKSMIAHGTAAELNATDSTGRTALHRGAFFNQHFSIAILVESGASASVLDSHGRTALDVATSRGSKEAAAILSTTTAIVDPARAPASNNTNNSSGEGEECAITTTTGSSTGVIVTDGSSTALTTAVPKQEPTAPKKRVRFGDGSPDRSREYVKLLTKRAETAPADRAWRRRRFLVLCRAHPGRLRLLLNPEVRGGGDAAAAAAAAAAVAPAAVVVADSVPGVTMIMKAAGGEGGTDHDGGRGSGEAEGSSAKTRSLRAPAADSAKTRSVRARAADWWLDAGSSGSSGGGGVAGLMTRILLLEEDGLFRIIVGFL